MRDVRKRFSRKRMRWATHPPFVTSAVCPQSSLMTYALCPNPPLVFFKSYHPAASYRQSLGGEEVAFELRRGTVPADLSAGGNDAVVGQSGPLGRPHDRADGACGARSSRKPCDIAVRDHAARGDSADDSKDRLN